VNVEECGREWNDDSGVVGSVVDEGCCQGKSEWKRVESEVRLDSRRRAWVGRGRVSVTCTWRDAMKGNEGFHSSSGIRGKASDTTDAERGLGKGGSGGQSVNRE